jgi:polysaccharide pyruvyl transferase WcaK-like protein
MNIGVIGWWHHDNQGDLAMLHALTSALEAYHIVPIDVGFAVNGETLRRLNRLDFLMLGGGTLFDSTPPFPFDTFDAWGRDLHTPLGAIGIGVDMVTPRYRQAVNCLLDQSAFFYVRDRHSQQVVGHATVQLAPDITFLQPLPPARLPDDGHERRIVCGVNLRRAPGLDIDHWVEAMGRLPYSLRGVPFSTYHAWQELSILQQLDEACAPAFRPDLFDGLNLMIGTAFHSVVLAVQAAVPVIAIGSTPKVRHFMQDVGLSDYVLEPNDWNKLGELSNRVLTEQDQLRQQLRQLSAALAGSAQQMITEVKALIGNAPARQEAAGPKVSLIVVGGTSFEANRQSIESCLDQTYPNIEVLFLGHDPEVSRQYGSSDARLKIISADGESLGACLNQALAHTSGEYLSWIMAGDLYARDAIDCMVDFLQNEPAEDMVFTDFFTIHDRKRIADARAVLEPHKLIRRNVVGPSFLFRHRLSQAVGPVRADTPLADYDYWLRANQVCRLRPLHVLLFYSQLPHQAIYHRAAERATRRHWYATRSWLIRTAGFLIDADFIESFVVRPFLAVRRSIRSRLSQSHRLASDINRSKA